MKRFWLAFFSIVFLPLILIGCSDDDPEPEPEPTPEPVPGAINTPPSSFKVEVSGITKDSAVIRWSKPVDADKDKLFYTVVLGTNRLAVKLGDTVYIATKLAPETDYKGYVLAYDAKDTTRVEFAFKTKDPYLKFNKTYDFDGVQWSNASAICKTDDQGYIIAGSVSDREGWMERWAVHVVKMDSLGNLIWNRRYPVYATDQKVAIAATKDGGFVLTSGPILLRIDSQGNQLWSKEINQNVSFSSIVVTNDNSMVTAGRINLGIIDEVAVTRAVMMKFNSGGDVIWQKNYGENVRDFGSDVIQTTNGDLMLLGSLGRDFYNHTNYWVVNTDSDGNINWQREYGDSGGAFAEVIKETPDGGYVIGGSSWGAYDFSQMRVIKIDKNGMLKWDNYYRQSLSFQTNDLEVTKDGGYVLTGYLKSNAELSPMYLGVYKLNSSGEQVWGREYERTLWNYGNDILQTADDGYMITGTVSNLDYSKVWVLKLNPLGLDN